jgi:hypothetical protein
MLFSKRVVSVFCCSYCVNICYCVIVSSRHSRHFTPHSQRFYFARARVNAVGAQQRDDISAKLEVNAGAPPEETPQLSSKSGGHVYGLSRD